MNYMKNVPLLFLCFVLFLTVCMLCYPQTAYQGACNGINTWAVHLLPALLPFFIAANLLTALGFVRFVGTLLEPIMRPVFRLPGEAGFAVALGFTSGFPMGAVLTASLREQNLCTDHEAARLAAFTNNSSPLFLLIAVPVSMLQSPQFGIVLLLAHYIANLCIGILLRFTAVRDDSAASQPQKNLLSNAFLQMQRYQQDHSQSIGTILGQAIQKGISSIVNIGGFVLFFSVLLSMLEASGLLLLLDAFFRTILNILHLSPQLSGALSSGLFEMTLGAQSAAQCDAELLERLMVISFILSWSGLSIQAQVCSILSSQQIPTKLYCLCRPLQGLLAALLVPILISCCPWLITRPTMQTMFPIEQLPITPANLFGMTLCFAGTILGTLLLLSFAIRLLQIIWHCILRIVS